MNAEINIALYSFGARLDTKVSFGRNGDVELLTRRRQEPVNRLRVVRRDCSPNSVPEVVEVPPDIGRKDEDDESKNRNRDWSPTQFHYERLERLRQRILRVAILEGAGFRLQEFQGSLEKGLDVRRSVRSVVRDGKLFVRIKARGPRPTQIRTAPIVWILREERTADINTKTLSIEMSDENRPGSPGSVAKNEFVRCQAASYDSSITETLKEPKVTIGFFYIAGRISFLPFVGSVEADFFPGYKISDRVPNHSTMVHPAGVGCLDAKLEPVAHQRRWDELLLLTASLYAGQCVILVAPQSYQPEARVQRTLTGRRQQLLRVDLEILNSTERLWLERLPTAEGDTRKLTEEQYESDIWPRLESSWR